MVSFTHAILSRIEECMPCMKSIVPPPLDDVHMYFVKVSQSFPSDCRIYRAITLLMYSVPAVMGSFFQRAQDRPISTAHISVLPFRIFS
jgi:hypothetical protein